MKWLLIILLWLFGSFTTSQAVDFNHDGNPDYVLYNQSTRQTAIWYLNNNALIGSTYGPALPANWSLISEGDFNGDGDADYLLFNANTRQTAIWYFAASRAAERGPAFSFVSSNYGPTIPAGWVPVAIGDFNGDGHLDLVLFNPGGGQTAIWNLNNHMFIGAGFGPVLPSGYLLVAAGDFNRDGKPDYLLFNPRTRQTALWYLNNRTLIGSAFGPNAPNGWTVEDLADFNHDGRPDYLLNQDRVTALWYLNGNILLGSAYGPTITAGWGLAAANARPCTFSIAPHSAAFGPQGGSGNVYVSTLGFGCVWHAVSNTPWIHITSGSNYVGSGYASYTVEAVPMVAPSDTQQTGSITVAGQIVTITQTTVQGFSGTWSGTVTGQFCFNGCCVPGTETYTVTYSQTGNSISGPGTLNSVPCIDSGNCSVADLESNTGTASGSVSGTTITQTFTSSSHTGICPDNAPPFTFTGTLSGNTINGSTASGNTVTLTRQ